jgi:hypothetical protein
MYFMASSSLGMVADETNGGRRNGHPCSKRLQGDVREQAVGRRRVGRIDVALEPEPALAVKEAGALLGRKRLERRLEELRRGAVDVGRDGLEALAAPFGPVAAVPPVRRAVAVGHEAGAGELAGPPLLRLARFA